MGEVSERFTISARDGTALEAELDAPGAPRAALVLCHPHPRMDGTMNAPLLLALRDRMTAEGWAVLRFNFRGIGLSEGETGTGLDEVADALGAVDAVRARAGPLPVALAGWSFGGAVAVRAAEADDSLVGCVGVAPAITPTPDVTAGLPPAADLDLGVPLLFVCAGRDRVVDPGACRSWLEPVEAADVVELRGANHFFWGRYDDLCDVVAGWLDERIG
jgi:alpha/beta superfamily hydrolase